MILINHLSRVQFIYHFNLHLGNQVRFKHVGYSTKKYSRVRWRLPRWWIGKCPPVMAGDKEIKSLRRTKTSTTMVEGSSFIKIKLPRGKNVFNNFKGWGMFHTFILGLVCTCGLSAGIAAIIFPLTIPFMMCDIIMTSSIVGTLNICLGLGTALGGVFFCGISDIFGRRGIINFTLILIFLGAMICSVAYYYSTLIVGIIILGASIWSNFNVVKIYLAEVLPLRSRGRYLVLVDFFFTLGYIGLVGLTSGVTHLMLKQPFPNNSVARTFTWRMLFGILGLWAIVLSCTTSLLFNGPRYLIYMKRYKEALETLREMFAINQSKHGDHFNIEEMELYGLIHGYGIAEEPHFGGIYVSDRGFVMFKRMHRCLMLLFDKMFIKTTFIITIIKIFTNYGLVLLNIWLYKIIDINKDGSLTSTDLFYFALPSDDCKQFPEGTHFYIEFMIISSFIAVGQIILFIFIDTLGRKKFACGGFFCGGILTITLYFITNSNCRLICACAIIMFYSVADSSINIILIEAYPTAIRGTASGQTQFLSRIVLVFVRHYINVPYYVPIFYIGISMLVSSGLTWYLPNLRRKPMVE